MKVLVVGATGMVGRGVLRECLASPDVALVRTLGRTASEFRDSRLQDILVHDMFDVSPSVWHNFSGFDACFFCLGVSSSGKSERVFTRLTLELALTIARPLAQGNPAMVLTYVSGAGTDSRSKTMWARVKGETEEKLAALPFAAVYSLRPAIILPMNAERSAVRSYRVFYRLFGPILRPLRKIAPQYLLTTETIGKAMLALARRRPPSQILEVRDIYFAARSAEKKTE